MNQGLTKTRQKRSFRRVLLPFAAGIAAILIALGGTAAFSAELGGQGDDAALMLLPSPSQHL